MNFKNAILGLSLAAICSNGAVVFATEFTGKAKEELAKFQGSWVLESAEKGGKPASAEHLAKGRCVISGDTVKLVIPHITSSDTEIVTKIVKFDVEAGPKEQYFVRQNGPHAGQKMVAIYEFVNKDKYKWAFDESGKETLKEFKTRPDSEHVWNVWKREGTK